MTNKLVILLMFVGLLAAQQTFSQSIRPLGLNFETTTHYDEAEWKWTPLISFRVLGPIESGSQITVDITLPNGKLFVTARCETYPLKEGEHRRVDLCGRDLEFSKAINQTGLFTFQIKLGNALDGTNKVLYAGKFSVGRKLYNPYGTPEKNKQFHYFVDNDWRLSYAYFASSYYKLHTQFWVKNRLQNLGAMNAYLYYNGKQIAETSQSGSLTAIPKENPLQEYNLLEFTFPVLTEKPDSDDNLFKVYENPGDYEIKFIRDKKLARSIKFSIGKDGKYVQTGVGKELVGVGIITPIQILGDTDGVYNKLAWKDGAFGNPISNLVIP